MTDVVKVEMVRATLVSLERNVEIYAEKHEGRYPESLAVVLASEDNLNDATRDLWGRTYRYVLKTDPGDEKPYGLYSAGPDGRDGTPDDIYAQKSK